MKNIQCDFSSLKFFNFDGWSKEKIIDKYEVVLTSREKQITDLSIEIGSLNDRINNLSDNNSSLQDENEMLKIRLQKRENILNQELNNKEIMFMRLERTEQECDELKRKLEKYEKAGVNKEIPFKEKDSRNKDSNSNTAMAPSFNVSKNVNILDNLNNISNNNSNKNDFTSSSIDETKNISEVKTTKSFVTQKSSALVIQSYFNILRRIKLENLRKEKIILQIELA
jgi:hypothetical protein